MKEGGRLTEEREADLCRRERGLKKNLLKDLLGEDRFP